MQSAPKEWLVRTRAGELLGPFTQRELFIELQKNSFSYEDEIAPSRGRWLSAQLLASHDTDEFTHTSTRNQTFTGSTVTGSVDSPSSDDAIHVRRNEELTPTPEFIPHPTTPPVLHPKAAVQTSEKNRSGATRTLIAIGVLIVLWGLTGLMRRHSSSAANNKLKAIESAESEFVRQIYGLMQAGETQAALKQLTLFHERADEKKDLEYLIPYAALLITESDSPARAKRLLEQVLKAPSAPDSLKAKAQHWLGYLMLSQDQADRATANFLEALELNPKDAASRFNLGRSYLKEGKFAQALEYFQLAELDMPRLWLVHIYKGRAYESLANPDRARESYRTAIEVSPDRWMSYIYSALFLMQNNELEAAQNTLRKMITRDPQYELQAPPPFGFYQERVNYRDYLTSYSLVMERAAAEDRELGRTYLSFLLTGRAEDDRLENLSKSGNLFAKIVALKIALDTEVSKERLSAMSKRLPLNLSTFGFYAYVLRGEVRMRLSQVADAQRDFQQAVELAPQAAIARWAYVSWLRKNQQTSEAQTELSKLLAAHPDYIPAVIASHEL